MSIQFGIFILLTAKKSGNTNFNPDSYRESQTFEVSSLKC